VLISSRPPTYHPFLTTIHHGIMAPPVRDGQDNLQPNSYGNGHARNVFEAPPSTMAVQLINNLASSNNKPSQQPQLDDLKRLMAEISETESSPNLRTDVKVKLEHKHKLIYVFARAVLDRLLSDDPFNNIAQLVSQSSEALEIFISAIREVPAVLEFVLPNGQVLQNRDKEPLWLWLFPKVLAILGRPGCEGLTDKIREFFCICFHMVARSPKLWHLNSNFFMYLKECITGMQNPVVGSIVADKIVVLLSHLQNPGIIPHGTMGAVKLPSNEGEFFSVFTHKVPLLDAGLEYTYTIRETPDAVRHLDILLSMLVEILTEAWILYDATPAFEDYMAWLSDTLLVVHEMQKRLRSTPKLLETCEDGSVLLLRAMQCLLSSLDNSHPDAMRRKGSMTLAILLADLLDMPNQRLNEPTLLSICRSILTLSVACQHYNSVHRFVLVHLLPAIRRILGDKETLGGFGNDFQVCPMTQLKSAYSNSNRKLLLLSVTRSM
jgi:serine/threonine-protein kinase ATR